MTPRSAAQHSQIDELTTDFAQSIGTLKVARDKYMVLHATRVAAPHCRDLAGCIE
jgi:hypothetical protein